MGLEFATRLSNLALRLRTRRIHFSTDMPVFINCRDRVTTLVELVRWLEDEGMTNIVLVDNASTYEPLLEYYQHTSARVVRLGRNVGSRAPWLNELDALRGKGPYIVTDSDVVPQDDAHGAIRRFVALLNSYPGYQKVGFGLRIDDLPDHYRLREQVRAWESQFWKREVEPQVFHAPIDTTFALYREGSFVYGPGLRTGIPYVARHIPWYVNSKALSDEEAYYELHASRDVTTWGANENFRGYDVAALGGPDPDSGPGTGDTSRGQGET